MGTNPIQSLWVEGKIGTMERLCVRSFLANDHDFHLYVYDDVKGVPEGATIRDGREILTEDKIFTYQTEGFGKGGLSGFANWFRYALLQKRGGWWVDMDVICVQPFDFEQERILASNYEGAGGYTANNCVMKLPPEDPLAEYCLNVCEQVDPESVQFGETGPVLVNEGIRELGGESYTVPGSVFCPVSYQHIEDLVSPPLSLWERLKRKLWRHQPIGEIQGDTHAVHLWNQMWKDAGLDKEGTYPSESIYERLKRQYLP
jgi:hypothetical protein